MHHLLEGMMHNSLQAHQSVVRAATVSHASRYESDDEQIPKLLLLYRCSVTTVYIALRSVDNYSRSCITLAEAGEIARSMKFFIDLLFLETVPNQERVFGWAVGSPTAPFWGSPLLL